MRTKFIVLGLCLIFLWGAGKTNAQDKKPGPEKFTGRALVVGSPASGTTTWFAITIQEYTSDEDTLKYATILKEQGQQAFRQALEKIEVGWIAPTGQIREPINIARSHDVEGGRVINIVKTRYLSFLEFALGTPRSRDYDITFIQLKIDENGKGEGFMSAGTKLMFDENNKLVLEQIGTSSIRLSSIKLKK
jgi:hypothetical protein